MSAPTCTVRNALASEIERVDLRLIGPTVLGVGSRRLGRDMLGRPMDEVRRTTGGRKFALTACDFPRRRPANVENERFAAFPSGSVRALAIAA